MKTRLADERGFVIASMIRLVVFLVLVGLVVVEGASILFASLTLQDAAEVAALNAADQLDAGQSVEEATDEAVRTLGQRDPDISLLDFEVLPDGGVRIRVRKKAATILVHRIGPLEDLALVEASATGRPVSGGV
jgi:Flp pilus assembly protein TadG